jgi:hypothetical protein
MAFNVGSDVEAMCRTCGDVWHVVVAKLGDKITKVECKQCGKQHRFKPTGDAPEANLQVRRQVVSPRPVGAARPKAKPSSTAAGVVHDPNRPAREYSIHERYEVGEQLLHKKFGPGIVVAVEDEKVRVKFSESRTEGIKVLLHGRAAPG